VVLADGARPRARARRHPAGQSAQPSRAARVPRPGIGRVALRRQTPVPAGSEFGDVSAVVDARRRPGGRRPSRITWCVRSTRSAIDALCQITGTSEQYSSAIPEPFTFLPQFTRAITLADGSITSPFLTTFGRPARDTGLESERAHQPSAAERLHLLNSSHVQQVEQSPVLQVVIGRGDMRQAVTLLYVTILSRMPSEPELKVAAEYAQTSAANRRQAGLDLAWALINTTEFLYRH
jgi:hypothetical protein